jgi:hypothetical protein
LLSTYIWSGILGCHWLKLFPAGNTSAFGIFSRIRRGKIPGRLDIPEVFPARKILIRDILGLPVGD